MPHLRRSHCIAASLAAAAFALAAPLAHAASEEVQVYLDDLTRPGSFGADLHNNFTLKGSRTPEFPGALPTHHMYRFTPELYYGLTPTMELGLYLLTTAAPGEGVHYEGQKVRFKYIAPHDEKQGSFWGINVEVGRTSGRVSEVPWNAELKGIYGFRSGPWTVGFNANFDWSLHGSPNTPVGLEITSKVSYDIHDKLALGFESYNELGPVKRLGNLNQQAQTLYGVVDAQLGKIDLNAGIGRGLTATTDRWVLKLIVGLQY